MQRRKRGISTQRLNDTKARRKAESEDLTAETQREKRIHIAKCAKQRQRTPRIF